MRRRFLETFDGLDAIGKEMNVKVHFILNGAPDHVFFALLEADDAFVVARYLTNVPLRQDFKTTPLIRQSDLATALRQAAE